MPKKKSLSFWERDFLGFSECWLELETVFHAPVHAVQHQAAIGFDPIDVVDIFKVNRDLVGSQSDPGDSDGSVTDPASPVAGELVDQAKIHFTQEARIDFAATEIVVRSGVASAGDRGDGTALVVDRLVRRNRVAEYAPFDSEAEAASSKDVSLAVATELKSDQVVGGIQ